MTDDAKPGSEMPKARKAGVRPVALFVGVAALAAGGFALYGMGRPASKNVAHSGTCAASLDAAAAIEPLVHGEVAALTIATQPNPLGLIAFDDDQGLKRTVASFKGQTILLNLWATWCAPCRAEMPSLDRLQAALGSAKFAVVPVNVDTTRLEKPKAFLQDIGATKLPFYSDKSADIVHAFKASQGLPTSVLIGSDGCEIATMAGPATWDSPDAKALIERIEKTAAERGGAV